MFEEWEEVDWVEASLVVVVVSSSSKVFSLQESLLTSALPSERTGGGTISVVTGVEETPEGQEPSLGKGLGKELGAVAVGGNKAVVVRRYNRSV